MGAQHHRVGPSSFTASRLFIASIPGRLSNKMIRFKLSLPVAPFVTLGLLLGIPLLSFLAAGTATPGGILLPSAIRLEDAETSPPLHPMGI